MYTRDLHDLATLMNIADAFLGPGPLLSKKPSTVAAYRLNGDASPKRDASDEGSAVKTVSAKRRRIAEPTFDWEAAEGGVTLHAATPGLKKEDLSIRIVDEGAHRYLVVSGGTKDPADANASPADTGSPKTDQPATDAAAPPAPKQAPADAPRIFYTAFEHRMRLPAGVTSDCLSAKYEDGMLSLHVALPQPKPPQSEAITIA